MWRTGVRKRLNADEGGGGGTRAKQRTAELKPTDRGGLAPLIYFLRFFVRVNAWDYFLPEAFTLSNTRKSEIISDSCSL